MSGYNYGSFDAYVASGAEERELLAFRNVLHAGERAPDGRLERLSDGVPVTLSSLWSAKPVILEFGSFTWPGHGRALDDVATRFPQLEWLYVYTREARPAGPIGAHTSIADKLACARRLRDDIGIRREILMDDLQGTVHTRYGLLPNMAWVIGPGGIIHYKATWTSPERIAEYCARLVQKAVSDEPFYSEQLEWRALDRPVPRPSEPIVESEQENADRGWLARARKRR